MAARTFSARERQLSSADAALVWGAFVSSCSATDDAQSAQGAQGGLVVDLSQNRLASLAFLADAATHARAPAVCAAVRVLNVSHNRLASLAPLAHATHLRELRACANIPGSHADAADAGGAAAAAACATATCACANMHAASDAIDDDDAAAAAGAGISHADVDDDAHAAEHVDSSNSKQCTPRTRARARRGAARDADVAPQLLDAPWPPLNELEVLSARSCMLTRIGGLGLPQTLRVLDLACNRIAELPRELAELPCLRELCLESNCLTGAAIDGRLPASLRRLQLSDNELRALPASFANARGLEQLALNNTLLELAECRGVLEQLGELQILELTSNALGNHAANGGELVSLVQSLGCAALRVLDLSDNLLDADTEQALNAACPATLRIYVDADLEDEGEGEGEDLWGDDGSECDSDEPCRLWQDRECAACTRISGGGELVILCDGCDAAWHLPCAGLAGVPEGDWFCASCLGKPARAGAVSANSSARARAPDAANRSSVASPSVPARAGAAGEPAASAQPGPTGGAAAPELAGGPSSTSRPTHPSHDWPRSSSASPARGAVAERVAQSPPSREPNVLEARRKPRPPGPS